MKRFSITLVVMIMLVGLSMSTVQAGGRRYHGGGHVDVGYGHTSSGRTHGYRHGYRRGYRRGVAPHGYQGYGYQGYGYPAYGYGGHGYGGQGGGLWIATPHFGLQLGH